MISKTCIESSIVLLKMKKNHCVDGRPCTNYLAKKTQQSESSEWRVNHMKEFQHRPQGLLSNWGAERAPFLINLVPKVFLRHMLIKSAQEMGALHRSVVH